MIPYPAKIALDGTQGKKKWYPMVLPVPMAKSGSREQAKMHIDMISPKIDEFAKQRAELRIPLPVES
jgi:hypothetical protein